MVSVCATPFEPETKSKAANAKMAKQTVFKKLAQNANGSNAIWQRLVSWMASDARDHSPLNLFKKRERERGKKLTN